MNPAKVSTGDRTTDIILLLVIATVALGGIYIITTNLFKIPDPIADLLEQQKKNLEAKVKAIKDLKLKPNIPVTLSDTEEKAKAIANGIAIILRRKLEGYTTEEDHRFIYTLFKKKLNTSNDVRLVFKAFGVLNGENLIDYINSEHMPANWKEYMLGKLAKSLTKT